MQCLILAGGLATRLRPITKSIPKSMVKVLGKPFLEYQIGLLVRNGVRDILLCVGHLGEQVENYFGDGNKFGITIKYSYEKGRLLGTGGAIRNAIGSLGDEFFVLYGDSYLDINYEEVREHFSKVSCPALLVVYRNENKWDSSNVILKNRIVEVYDKENHTSGITHIDYGLSVLSKAVIEDIPKGVPYDLADLYKDLSSRRKLAGHEVFNRFYEIGSLNGLKEFESFIEKRGQ